MSTPTGLFRGTRALLAKYTAASSTPAAAATAAVTEVGSASKFKDRKKKSKGSVIDLNNTKTLPISPALQSFVGCHEISLGEACKKLWAHIHANNLQKNEVIILDDTLKKLFDGRDELKPQDLAKRLCSHFVN